MLVLSRKTDDEIIIDEKIQIRVLRVKGNTVRIGITAPADVNIMRGELPRREIEFELPAEFESDADTEQEAEPEFKTAIRFQRYAPHPPQRNRLAELVRKVTQD